MHCCVTTILIALKEIKKNFLFFERPSISKCKKEKIKSNQILQSSIDSQAVAESKHFKKKSPIQILQLMMAI